VMVHKLYLCRRELGKGTNQWHVSAITVSDLGVI
jgi:hypothetical protein